jgi:tRNA-dihydrouridine synthase B
MHNVTSNAPDNGIQDIFSKKSFPLCMAPMVGLSHAVFRQIAMDYLPEPFQSSTFWPTEMLNSRKVPSEILGKNSETYILPDEKKLVPQLLGNNKSEIQDSIVRLSHEWKIYGVDINMGCPVQKALKHNYGVSLMGDIDYATNVVKYAKQATEIIFEKEGKRLPVSVKLRAVNSDKSADELCRIVDLFAQAGADWITLHPRTAEQKRKGQADWDQIKFLKQRVSIPIIGNGDIQTCDDVFQMMNETNADKVMSGRALTVRPWLFWQVSYRLQQDKNIGSEISIPPLSEIEEGAEYGRMLYRFIELTEQHFIQKIGLGESLVMRKIQFFVRTNHVWLQFGHQLMSLMNRSKSIAEMKDHVLSFFNQDQVMYRTTQLRQ